MFSYGDAVYCAKFVHELHRMDTPFFSSLQYYDRVLRDVCVLVTSCTEYEAGCLGRFLAETMHLLTHWRSERSVYEEECKARVGFAINFTDPVT